MSIDCTVYARGRGSVSASFAEAYRATQEPGNLAWIALVEPAEEDFGVIAPSFGLEPQLLEEAVRFPHRSDIEKHEDRLIAVLPILRTSAEEADIKDKPGSRSMNKDWVLALAVGEPNMIFTFTDGDPAVLDKLRRRMEVKLDLTAEDARAVLFEIVSEVIGDYEDAVEAIDRRIWDAEVTVMEGRSGDVLRQIHNLTSQAVGLQQAVKPLASALELLSDSDAPLTHRRLTRIRHRALRVTERLDSARELLSSLLQVNLTLVGQKISAWGAILIVPSLIAGVFGMNFTDAWWTTADHGFEVMIGFMLLVSGALYLWFRRSGWL
ncbi:MAG TPA: CorA family divalent cation transporter [Rubrobacter sp.]